MDRTEKLCERIFNSVLLNYDEKINFPYTTFRSLLISDDAGFEIPENIFCDIPENAFVDELFFDDATNDVELCISVPTPDGGSERIDETDILNLPEEYLERLVIYAENHKGSHIES